MNKKARLSENAWHLAQALQHMEKLHAGEDVRFSPPAKKMMATCANAPS